MHLKVSGNEVFIDGRRVDHSPEASVIVTSTRTAALCAACFLLGISIGVGLEMLIFILGTPHHGL
jgi:hypothetical protein